MKTIYFFSNIASHYRKHLWIRILQLEDTSFHLFFGNSGNTGIREIDFSEPDFSAYGKNIKMVKNHWVLNKAVLWQSGVVKYCIKDKIDIAIFTGEMLCFSTWIAAIICRFRKIEIVFWGHGFYGNEGKLKLFVRKSFYKLANQHLLYGKHSKQLMINNGFYSEKLHIIFNSLDYDLHKVLRNNFIGFNKNNVFSFFSNPQLPVLIFIGRLTTEKKIEMLLTIAEELNRSKTRLNLLIIGDGEQKQKLENRGNYGLAKKWLHFTGSIYDEETNGKYLYFSDLCVSPGNVGLTAIHSLSFGTPVGTHGNFYNQGPEVNAVIENYNGFLFEENNLTDLSNKILAWIENNTDREGIRKQCYEIVDKYYNPEYQIRVLSGLINNEKPEL